MGSATLPACSSYSVSSSPHCQDSAGSGTTFCSRTYFCAHQLQVALRSRPRTRLKTSDRLLWLAARSIYPGWRRHLILARPETVLRWHRRGWRLYWRWRSRLQLGRPRLSPEVRELITTMAGDNSLWGTERIRGELLKLGIVVSSRPIRRYRRQLPFAYGLILRKR